MTEDLKENILHKVGIPKGGDGQNVVMGRMLKDFTKDTKASNVFQKMWCIYLQDMLWGISHLKQDLVNLLTLIYILWFLFVISAL